MLSKDVDLLFNVRQGTKRDAIIGTVDGDGPVAAASSGQVDVSNVLKKSVAVAK